MTSMRLDVLAQCTVTARESKEISNVIAMKCALFSVNCTLLSSTCLQTIQTHLMVPFRNALT